MITFYIIAALLIVVAIGLIAPPLWRGRLVSAADSNAQNIAIARERLAELEDECQRGMLDEQSFAQAKIELEKTLAGDLGGETPSPGLTSGGSRTTLAVVAVLVPVVTLALYLLLGAPQHLTVAGGAGEANPHGDSAEAMPSMEALLQRLTKRLEQNPEDADGWFMLGRTYMQFENYPEAVKAYERLNAIVGEHPVALLALADALAMNSHGTISGRPAELARKALQLEPNNITALWLVGMAAEEQEQYAEAVSHWQQIIPLLEPSDPSVPELQQRIAGARAKLTPAQAEQLAKAAPPAAAVQPAASAAAVQLKVRVTLAPELRAKADPDATVFIYARAMEGMPMPLAVARHQVRDLPLEVVLDDSMAMVPTARLSNFSQVRVGARISKSGQATAQSGDLLGELENISTASSQALSITIERVVP